MSSFVKNMLPNPQGSCSPVPQLENVQAFADTFWLADNTRNPKSCRLKESIYRLHILPFWHDRNFESIAKQDVEEWLETPAMSRLTAATRNRILYVFKSILRLAYEKGYLRKRQLQLLNGHFLKEERRTDATLAPDKMKTLMASLRKSPAIAARVLELLLITGARKNEILTARWEDFDPQNHMLIVRGYNDKAKKIWLSPLALKVINCIEPVPDSPWLFPGRDPEKPLSDIYLFWNALRHDCGLGSMRIQDLKHNHVNWQAARNGSAQAIEELFENKIPQKSCQKLDDHIAIVGLAKHVAAAIAFVRKALANSVSRERVRVFIAGEAASSGVVTQELAASFSCPLMAIDSKFSFLTAMHLACSSLRQKAADMAIVFDTGSQEAIVLKLLGGAKKDHNSILAIIDDCQLFAASQKDKHAKTISSQNCGLSATIRALSRQTIDSMTINFADAKSTGGFIRMSAYPVQTENRKILATENAVPA